MVKKSKSEMIISRLMSSGMCLILFGSVALWLLEVYGIF